MLLLLPLLASVATSAADSAKAMKDEACLMAFVGLADLASQLEVATLAVSPLAFFWGWQWRVCGMGCLISAVERYLQLRESMELKAAEPMELKVAEPMELKVAEISVA